MPSLAAPEPATPVRRSAWRAAVGALWVVGAVVCAILSRESLLAGHPAYPVTLVAVAVIGVLLVATGLHRVPVDRPRHRLAMSGSAAVRVESSPTRIVLTPTATPARAGLVFQPGAKVDPRAYVPLLEQVSAAGYLVTIVKQPYAIGFLAIGEPGDVIAATPGVAQWAVGGHSLGGVAAGQYASQPGARAGGVLFWASYPLGSLAARSDLVVASVSGTADGLSTPADIEASRANLPPGTVFTAVEGGIHAYFGDYGPQAGDGTPTVDRATAQQQIVTATLTFMGAVART